VVILSLGEIRRRYGPRAALAWGLIWLGFLLVLPVLGLRALRESRPAPVQITLDYTDCEQCADSWAIALPVLLQKLRAAGATAVAVQVQTLETLADRDRIHLEGRSSALQHYPGLAIPGAPYNFLAESSDSLLLNRVRFWLALQEPGTPPKFVRPDALAVAIGPLQIPEWPVGYDQEQLATVRAAGLGVTIGLSNPYNLTPGLADAMLRGARATGARIVVFQKEATGYQGLLPVTASALRHYGLSFAIIEGSDQAGVDDLSWGSSGQLVRAHVIGPVDMARLQPGEVLDRFARAARERNIRILLVRLEHPALGDGAHPLRDNAVSLVSGLKAELTSDPEPWRGLRPRLVLGMAHPFGNGLASPRHVGPRAQHLALLAGRLGAWLAFLGCLILIAELCGWRFSARQDLAIVLVALPLLAPHLGARLLALAVACVFPVVALGWGGAASCFSPTADGEGRSHMRDTVWILTATTFLSVVGGCLVAGALADWTFLAGVDDFAGTKIAGLLPLVLALVLIGGEFWPQELKPRGRCDPRLSWDRLRSRARNWLERPFTLKSALVWGLGGLMVALWLARTGNDSGVAVSTLEWKFRASLEKIFIARPRTKEFLLCHPALVCGLYLARKGRRTPGAVLVMLGLIGQINVINSFAQVNDPLYIAFWRSVIGLALGAGLSLLIYEIGHLRLSHLAPAPALDARKILPRYAFGASGVALVLLLARAESRHRRYLQLTVPAEGTSWPWAGAAPASLGRGVTHWFHRDADGTTLDLLAFECSPHSPLKLALYDGVLASPSDSPGGRYPYWSHGVGTVARSLNHGGRLVALWNAGFFGLTNRKPREQDRAFHLSPVVYQGQVHFPGPNFRWTWGVNYRSGYAAFRLEHSPSAADLTRDFDFATGTLQALVKDGHPLELEPYPLDGATQIRPSDSTAAQAGAIVPLDFLRTSRCSVGWTKLNTLYFLFVKEPDDEAHSRADFAARRPDSGGWNLADEQRFWLSAGPALGVGNAVGLDGGDVAQLVYRDAPAMPGSRPGASFTVIAPRVALPGSVRIVRLNTDASFHKGGVDQVHGGALTYFAVLDTSSVPIRDKSSLDTLTLRK